jgi:ligand-binding sensor domain-containing protein
MEGRSAIALSIFLTCCHIASALNPSLDISQYAHKAWTPEDGLFKGRIYSIAQTPDGYLWLGTEFGLFRFDGVRSIAWQPPAGERLPSNIVTAVAVARDGRLWIGTRAGLASWKDGKLTDYAELAGEGVFTILEDREGTVWAGTVGISAGRVCAIRSGVQCYGQDGSLGKGVTSLYEENGHLWVSTATGVWRWKPGPPKLYAILPRDASQGLTDDNGRLLISMRGGIGQLVQDRLQPYPIPGGGPQFNPRNLLRDPDGSLWVSTTDQGLWHVHHGRADRFTQLDGLSDNTPGTIFEDREGNIWVATEGGLDRFRDYAVPTVSVKQGLTTTNVWSVLAPKDGSIWAGSREGLNRWTQGRVTIYRQPGGTSSQMESLLEDDRGRIWGSSMRETAYLEAGRFIPVSSVPPGQTHAIAEDSAGNFWFSQDQGLVRWESGNTVERIPWSKLLGDRDAMALAGDRVNGGLWLGLYPDGLVYFKDGRVLASYSAKDGLGEGTVAGIQFDPDGTLWAATEGGLSRVKNGHITTLSSRNGLLCNTVHWMMEDDDHSVWLYTACGLVRIARPELDAWAADPKRKLQSTIFDSADGIGAHAFFFSGYGPRVSKAADGKIWFLAGGGVSVLDPRHLSLNKLVPPVHVEQITGDRKIYWQNSLGDASTTIPLPPLVRDLEIDYTALSLVAPEKIRFKYKLEGRDRDWQEVGKRRQAFYSDLPPRRYHFRVAACNNSDVWNEAGASFDFSIAPAYYQTFWFQACCTAAFLVFLWGLYRLRLYQIAREFNVRLEERVGERTRIARDLHDTLLQSFQGLMLRLQVVDELLPPGKAKEQLEQTFERADQAIAEGRDAVHDLRSSTTTTNELAQALRGVADELEGEGSPTFRLVVEGAVRDLHPILRDEVYRIAREALRNAFNHSRAQRIEAEITYGERLLRLRIRDDGDGIPPAILEAGRQGHYGLGGIRERARKIGAKLDIWSGVGTGTEIDLSIPGSIAYSKSAGQSRLYLFRKKRA